LAHTVVRVRVVTQGTPQQWGLPADQLGFHVGSRDLIVDGTHEIAF